MLTYRKQIKINNEYYRFSGDDNFGDDNSNGFDYDNSNDYT